MRVLASVILTAVAVVIMSPSAQADAPSQHRMCLDNAAPLAQRAEACTFILTNAPPADGKELARVTFSRGNAYLNLGVYDRAVADFDAITKANPTANGPFNSRGLVYMRQKQVDRAITEFDSAIRLSPNDPIALTNRGDAYREKGRFERALQDYDAAIAINPKWSNAYFGRAAALQQMAISSFDAFVNEGSFEELAIAEYGKGLQIFPRNANVLSNRGLLHHTLRKYDLAIADFTQAIEINPANPVFLRNRAMTYRMMRQFDLAIADYRSALAMTQDADGRKLLGELLAQLGVTA